jgi:death-on-curing protein
VTTGVTGGNGSAPTVPFLHQDIYDEYLRWTRIVGDEEPYDTSKGIGIHDVLRAHFLIVDFFVESQQRGVGGVGPRDLNLLHSAINRQFVGFEGKEKWPDPLQKCATLLFGIVKNHAFHDANKRTAFLVALYQLDRQFRTPKIAQKDFEDFLVDVADSRLDRFARFKEISREQEDAEIVFIYDFLRRNTREIDKRSRTVTFHELNQLLRQHGFELVNPVKNYIDLVRIEYKRTIPIVGKRERRQVRIAQVGFPGWKRQVGKGTIRAVREAAGLTAEKGYDSKVFFEGADPLNALISQYEGPLRRLARR